MSTFQTEPAKREPRWAHRYVVHGLSVEEAARKVAAATGLDLEDRHSSFVGWYFRYRDRDALLELSVKLNPLEDGELVNPGMPEGVLLYYSSPVEDQFAAEFAAIPEIELLRKNQF